MKIKRAFLSFFAYFAICACMSVCAFANGKSCYKTVISHNTAEKTVRADIYISSGTAIVGYCSFDYDEKNLTLLDVNNSPIAQNVPDYCEDGKTTYLKNIITPHNDIVITDISKGASKLVNTSNGYVFFAWFLPSSVSHIDATGKDVLIATINFAVKDGGTLKENCIVPATKALTGSVGGWFPGLVVLDNDKKQFSYDGENTGKEYYSYVFLTDGKENKNEDGTKGDEDKNENADSTNTENQTQGKDDGEENNEVSNNDNNNEDNDNNSEKKEENEKTETDENCPSDDNENDGISLAPSAKKCDFNIETVCETNQIKIKWTKPEIIKEADSYNIFIYDEDFFLVQKISGISSMSNSYTLNGLCGGRTYKIYILAIADKNAYSSNLLSITTPDYEEYPEVISFTVTYDKTGAYLYGNSSEEVLYGENLTKIPTVYPKDDGKYFVGWSKDKKNVLDIENERIYSSFTLYPVYSESEPEKIKPYINGYSDGTFSPNGEITRAESATLISKISDKFSESARYCNTFTDCKSGMWYEKAVSFCASYGYIKGYSDGTFLPDGNITRAEFATVLVRVFGLENVTGIDVFSDLDGHWAAKYVFALYSCGYVKPDKDGKFRPDENITREDAVSMLNKCLGIIPDREKIDSYIRKNGYVFSDVPHYFDSYYDIMSAVME